MIEKPLDDQYYSDTGDHNVKAMMEESYREAITINQSFWSEADIDARFKAGDQEVLKQVYGHAPQRKQNFSFNRIRRVVDMICGYQRKNRKSMTVIPIEGSDEMTADQLSKVLHWATKSKRVLQTFSEAFESAVVTGMSMLEVWTDYRYDRANGDINVDSVPYNGFLVDPFFRKQDLSDCNYLWRRRWRSKEQVQMLFPEREEDIEAMRKRRGKDGKFQYMAESFNYSDSNLMALDEYWYMDTRKAKILEDVETGDNVEFFGDEETLQGFLEQRPNVVEKNIYIPTVKLIYSVNDQIFYHGPNPNGRNEGNFQYPIDRYPFVPVFSYYDPNMSDFSYRVQGVVRGLRDAQYLYDRRKAIELDILESQVNSGWVYEEGALIDPDDVYMTGQGKGIGVKQGKMGSVQKIDAPQIPPSMMELSKSLAEEVQQISGVSEELLGSATDDKAGVLSMLRQGAGLVTLQKLFDQADTSLNLLGTVMLEQIQANFKSGKIARIIGEEPTQQFKDRSFQKFDIQVAAGPDSETQGQIEFQQLIELKQMGLPIAEEDILEAATFQNKAKIIENMQRRQQASAQQEQMVQQMQMEKMQAEIANEKAKAASDQSLAVERISRVDENASLSEARQAQAMEDLQDAQLSKVKAIKELQDIDLMQVEKILGLVEMLKNQTIDDAEEAGIDEPGINDKVESLQTLNAAMQQLNQGPSMQEQAPQEQQEEQPL